MEHTHCGVFVPMGMGKTVSVLTAIDLLKLLGEITGKVLVVAPLRVARTTWVDEVTEWDHLSHLTVSVITGTEKERIAALRKKADIYTINYENLVWLEKNFLNGWDFEMVVADESTKLKGFRTRQGTKRAKVLGRYVHTKIKRFVQLTGTPAPNGVKDLWACGWFIDKGLRLGANYTAFINRWFRPDRSGFSYEPLPHAQKEIEEKLKDVCFSLRVEDHFDISKPIVNHIYIDMNNKARKRYDEMQKEMFTELWEVLGDKTKIHEVEALNAAAKTMKCLQFANGAAYVGEDRKAWVETHDEKIKALEDIIEEANGMPVLVAYNFRSDLQRLLKAFPKGKQLDKNPQTIKDWNAGKIPVLFAHPASAGHGLSLQHGGNILVFFSVNWNLEEHEQIIERIGSVRQKQSGYDRPVFIHYILARKTVDDLVLQRLTSKRAVQDLLMEAMKLENKQ